MKKATVFASFALLMGLTACGSKSEKAEPVETSMEEFTDATDSIQNSIEAAAEDINASSDIDEATETMAEDESDASEDESVEETESASSSSSESLLKAYEEYVDKYVTTIKKASAGDPRALAEYAGLYAKAAKLQEELEAAKDEFSASDLARMNKISAKMLKAYESMK